MKKVKKWALRMAIARCDGITESVGTVRQVDMPAAAGVEV